jgi:hypothetical protein
MHIKKWWISIIAGDRVNQCLKNTDRNVSGAGCRKLSESNNTPRKVIVPSFEMREGDWLCVDSVRTNKAVLNNLNNLNNLNMS